MSRYINILLSMVRTEFAENDARKSLSTRFSDFVATKYQDVQNCSVVRTLSVVPYRLPCSYTLLTIDVCSVPRLTLL